MKQNDEIEDLFRRRLSEEESPVSDRVWENIKKTLPPEKPEASGKKFLIGGILILVVVSAGLFINKNKNQTQQRTETSYTVKYSTTSPYNDSGIIQHNLSMDKNKSGNNQIVSRDSSEVVYASGIVHLLDKDRLDGNRALGQGKYFRRNHKHDVYDNLRQRQYSESSYDNIINKKQNVPINKSHKDGLVKQKNSDQSNNKENKGYRALIGDKSNALPNKTSSIKLEIGNDAKTGRDLLTSSLKGETQKITNTGNQGKIEKSYEGEISNADDKSSLSSNKLIREDKHGIKYDSSDGGVITQAGSFSENNTILDDSYENINSDTIDKSNTNGSASVNDSTSDTLVKEKKELLRSDYSKVNKSNVLENNDGKGTVSYLDSLTDQTSAHIWENKSNMNGRDTSVLLKDQNSLSVMEEKNVLSTTTQDSLISLNKMNDSIKSSVNTTLSENKNGKKTLPPIDPGISIDLLFSPFVAINPLKGDAEIINDRKANEKNKVSIGGGLNINIGLYRRWSGGIGLHYFSFGEKYSSDKSNVSYYTTIQLQEQYDSLKQRVTIDTIQVKHEKTKSASYSTTNYYRYISVPIFVSYTLKKEKWTMEIAGGLAVNILQSAHTGRLSSDTSYQVIEEVSKGSYSPFRKAPVSIYLQPAIGINLSKRWKFIMQPSFTYFLNSIYKKESPVQAKPYTLGLNAGLRFIIR